MWINLIMDFFAALALATEPPTISSTKGEPPKNMKVLSPAVWRQIIGLSQVNEKFISILKIFIKSLSHDFDLLVILE